MTEKMKNVEKKELKRLSRAELMEIIYEMKKNEMHLRKKLAAVQNDLKDQKIKLDNIGSIAEASLALNDVFGAAQRAVDTYIRSVEARYEHKDEKKDQPDDQTGSVDNLN